MGKPEIVVVGSDRQQCEEIISMLSGFAYQAQPVYTLEELAVHLQVNPARVVILDLDTVPAGNQFFRDLKKKNPHLFVLGASSRSYHPGLEEAMRSHIYACLAKPLDPEELFYWLKSIPEESSNPGEAI